MLPSPESFQQFSFKQMIGILVASVLILIFLMTHELKTPISVAYAANDALLNFPDDDSPEQRRKYLEISQSQLEHMSGLVEQILSISMERRKGLVLHRDDINLAALVDDIIEKHGWSISVESEPGKGTVFTIYGL